MGKIISDSNIASCSSKAAPTDPVVRLAKDRARLWKRCKASYDEEEDRALLERWAASYGEEEESAFDRRCAETLAASRKIERQIIGTMAVTPAGLIAQLRLLVDDNFEGAATPRERARLVNTLSRGIGRLPLHGRAG